MILTVFIFALALSLGFCQSTEIDADVQITVDLKKADMSEDIKLMAKLRFHLIEGQVHLNGRRLKHGVVTALHMKVQIVEIVKGTQNPAKLIPVHLRVLVMEKNAANGNKVLLVEEEFVAVADQDVLQLNVKQIMWESLVRKPVTIISLRQSQVHSQPRKMDHHIYEDGHEGHHYCHGIKKVKCWYNNLGLKSKIALFVGSFLFLLTVVLGCCTCANKRRQHQTMEVIPPMDDNVVVDVDEKKPEKNADGKYDFHFAFDNSVVVDDKKTLVA